MAQQTHQHELVSVIIPAYNEADSIRDVVNAAKSHPQVGEVLVIDDGSIDLTSHVAAAAGARVIRLATNTGKAHAMDIGVSQSSCPILCFLDADLIGLNRGILDRIIMPVASGRYDMFVGIRGRKTYWLNRLLRVTPIIGGERALTRSIWQAIPPEYKQRFQIEIAMNYFCKATRHRMGFDVVHGLSQIIKEKKWGLAVGLWRRLLMMGDIVTVTLRLYGILSLKKHYTHIKFFWHAPRPH